MDGALNRDFTGAISHAIFEQVVESRRDSVISFSTDRDDLQFADLQYCCFPKIVTQCVDVVLRQFDDSGARKKIHREYSFLLYS